MKFIAEIDVMPLKALLDPQGKAVTNSMANVGFTGIGNVRIGKHMTLEIEAESKEIAKTKINEACTTILSNPIMEGFSYTVKEVN